MNHMDKPIGVGIAGLGNVGAGVFKHLAGNRALIRGRTGFDLEVRKLAVRDVGRRVAEGIEERLLTGDWRDVIADGEVGIAVELMGRKEESLAFILAALESKKAVVTANKALLAEHGREIFECANRNGVPVLYEAAVAGGIPIIKAVRESFIGNHIVSIHGIINGTSNYILTRMTETGMGFEEALREAQAAGYAEPDPSFDVNGWDAAHKAIILASLAYGFWVAPDKVHVEGIEAITASDICFARKLGYRIKLLGVIKAGKDGMGAEVEVRVHPTLVPEKHVLASVNGVFNAVAVHGDLVGETLFYGRGAGQDATSSSVLGDIAEAAEALVRPRRDAGFVTHALYGSCRPIAEIRSACYLRLAVEDRPGVMSRVAGILGDLGISIASILQPESEDEGATVPLILMTHATTNRQIGEAMTRLAALDAVKKAPRMIRVEHFE